MKIRWSSRARLDLIEMGDYIARDNPTTALDWIIALEERAEQVARHPRAGRVVPGLEREDGREVIITNVKFNAKAIKEPGVAVTRPVAIDVQGDSKKWKGKQF